VLVGGLPGDLDDAGGLGVGVAAGASGVPLGLLTHLGRRILDGRPMGVGVLERPLPQLGGLGVGQRQDLRDPRPEVLVARLLRRDVADRGDVRLQAAQPLVERVSLFGRRGQRGAELR